MNTPRDWDSRTVYRSNEGDGPLRARIVSESPRGTYNMVRWNAKSPNRTTKFSVSADLLDSNRTGWRKIND